MARKKFLAVLGLTLVWGVVCFGFAQTSNFTQIAQADSWATGDGHNGKDGCAVTTSWTRASYTNGINNWNDDCVGASWRKYSVDSSPNFYMATGANTGAEANSWSTIQKKCKDIGATEVYRLAYEMYNIDTYISTKNKITAINASPYDQGPAVMVSQTTSGGGRTAIVETGVSWDTAYKAWQKAKEWAENQSNMTDWPNTSAFCYNPDWGDMAGKFESETFLEYEGGKEQSGVDKEKNAQTLKTDKDEVTLTFYHKLRYIFSSKDSNKKASFGEAKTDFDIPNKESGDGATKGSFSSTGNENKEWEEVSRETVKVTLKEGESKTVCRKIKYQPKNVTFKYENGKYVVKDDGKKDYEDSQICIKITRDEKEKEEPDPEGEEHEDRGKVYSMSGVGTRAGDDMIEIPIQMSERDGTVDVRVSTDEDHATVVFRHDLDWDEKLYDPDQVEKGPKWKANNEGKCDGKNWIPGSTSGTAVECDTDPVDVQYTPEPSADEKKDKFVEPVKVEWEVTQEESGTGSAEDGSDSGEYSITGKGPQTVYDERDIDLTGLEIGQELMVCQEITHPETIILEVKEVNHEAKEWTGDPSAEAKESCNQMRSDARGAQKPGKIDYNGQGNDEDYCLEPETEWDDKARPGIRNYPTQWNPFATGCLTGKEIEGGCWIGGNVFTGNYQTGGSKMEHEYDEGLMAHLRWDIKKKDEEGEKKSKACITIVRADDPVKPPEVKGPQGYVGEDQGTAKSMIMFAGQSANIAWEAKAKAFDVRRIINKQAITFLISVEKKAPNKSNEKEFRGTYNDDDEGKEFRNDGTSKEPRQNDDPCKWYTNKLGGDKIVKWCGAVSEDGSPVPGGGQEQTDHTQGGALIAVPNDVGFKYCNSFGYNWEYRWGVSKNGGAYEYTDYKKYWTIYNAACETIVKKPTVAVWNGGVFTNGGLAATLSSRSHQGDEEARTVVADVMQMRTFGSWTEYLVVANGNVADFASGATLSRGGQMAGWNNDFATMYSPMTIANVDESGMPSLGHAEIDQNTILTDRLKTYLKESSGSGPTSICAQAQNGQTRIFYTTEINCDVKIGNTYNSIYQIPQNIVISSGDITINSSVTRVDAWIIATEGTLKTCTEFKEEVTQTETRDKDFRSYSGGTCDKGVTINGPVFANQVVMNRTYGVDPGGAYSDNSKNDPDNQFYTPAEVFNLSAENYLWAYAQAGRYQSSYTNAYARELPPRY